MVEHLCAPRFEVFDDVSKLACAQTPFAEIPKLYVDEELTGRPEIADAKPRKTPIWFALSEDRPLFAFAGLWTHWRGLRGPESARVDGAHEVFCFLATEANATVAPIHPKGMPVILTSPEEVDRWLSEEMPAALALQRPLPDDALRIVAKGERSDGAPASA